MCAIAGNLFRAVAGSGRSRGYLIIRFSVGRRGNSLRGEYIYNRACLRRLGALNRSRGEVEQPRQE